MNTCLYKDVPLVNDMMFYSPDIYWLGHDRQSYAMTLKNTQLFLNLLEIGTLYIKLECSLDLNLGG